MKIIEKKVSIPLQSVYKEINMKDWTKRKEINGNDFYISKSNSEYSLLVSLYSSGEVECLKLLYSTPDSKYKYENKKTVKFRIDGTVSSVTIYKDKYYTAFLFTKKGTTTFKVKRAPYKKYRNK